MNLCRKSKRKLASQDNFESDTHSIEAEALVQVDEQASDDSCLKCADIIALKQANNVLQKQIDDLTKTISTLSTPRMSFRSIKSDQEKVN
jgi:hypothetical protein